MTDVVVARTPVRRNCSGYGLTMALDVIILRATHIFGMPTLSSFCSSELPLKQIPAEFRPETNSNPPKDMTRNDGSPSGMAFKRTRCASSEGIQSSVCAERTEPSEVASPFTETSVHKPFSSWHNKTKMSPNGTPDPLA
jgi:hypothetical protein